MRRRVWRRVWGRMRRFRKFQCHTEGHRHVGYTIGSMRKCRTGPHRLVLQWHVTERCNLRCTHCYQESYSGDELPFDDLLRLLQQYKDLLDAWGRPPWSSPSRQATVTVTGGEPFVRTDFLDLLEVFAAHRRRFSFAVLTNGSFINAALAYRLLPTAAGLCAGRHRGYTGHSRQHPWRRELRPDAGCRAALRAQRDSHDDLLSIAHRANFREFPEVCRLGRKLRVSRVWADRVDTLGQRQRNPRATADTW